MFAISSSRSYITFCLSEKGLPVKISISLFQFLVVFSVLHKQQAEVVWQYILRCLTIKKVTQNCDEAASNKNIVNIVLAESYSTQFQPISVLH